MSCAGGRQGRPAVAAVQEKLSQAVYQYPEGSFHFQETIARNIPFCDEFIIVTNKEYQFIVENQMKAFQGITYRLVLEEVGRKTTAAIVLSCLQFPFPS